MYVVVLSIFDLLQQLQKPLKSCGFISIPVVLAHSAARRAHRTLSHAVSGPSADEGTTYLLARGETGERGRGREERSMAAWPGRERD